MNQEKATNFKAATLAGLVAGFFSAIVKFGWEVPFPPRTPIRDSNNPPQVLLEKLGFSNEFAHTTYMFSDNPRPIMSFIVHFGFCFFFAILYSIWAEKNPKIKLWMGAMYGIVLYILFHVIIMPVMGVVPAPWNQPFSEHLSEFLGHIVWGWSIEIVRRDIRNRITHQPDAEFHKSDKMR